MHKPDKLTTDFSGKTQESLIRIIYSFFKNGKKHNGEIASNLIK
jgi:hypothetical protein